MRWENRDDAIPRDPSTPHVETPNHAPDPLRAGNIALLEVLEGLPDATVGAARDGRIVFVNRLAEQQFGYDREELLGQKIEILWPERVRDRYKSNLELYFELEHPLRFTERAYGRRKDGGEFVGEMSWGIVQSDDGPLLLAIGRNISDRLESEARLRRQSEQQAAVAALGERALRGVGPAELSEEAAERVRTVLGVERVEVLVGPREIAVWGAALERAASQISVPIHTGDRVHGTLVAVAARQGAFGDEEGSFLHSVANVLAIAFSRLHVEEQMRQQALHDSLTGLANRTLCRDRILHALAVSDREESCAAVLFVDVDNFKRVNDLFGHAAGDELLIALAQRMVAAVRPTDTVARLGGDEFVVVCESVDERTALALGWRVAAAVQEPLNAAGTEHQLAASIGIALGSGAGTDPDVLIGHADAAAYRAKERGTGRVELFDEGLRQRAEERLQTESDLEGALDRAELELVFQPIVSLADQSVVAHEALLRWQRIGPDIGPADFIPVAEESGLIIPIGSWVLEHACRSGARLVGGSARWISVNLSARQVAQPDLLEVVASALRAGGIKPESLSLELTETVLLGVTPAIVSNLERLHNLGVRLVLDDFGTGYSSFQHLKDFPIDTIKIDRSFVANLGRSSQDAAIVASVVSMASALGLGVVAEGVETETQAQLLRELGCPMAQGYFFGVPS
jgi:diguanylate cyclase (GGDEF)-like protein/PAS domain S-box-containing protein